MKKSENISLYIHIPFCESKCTYCAFNSFCANDDLKEYYVDLLCQEIVERKVSTPVNTIYIGGGTPSILTEKQLSKIVETVYENYNIYEDAEFTIEANPNSLTEEKLEFYKKLRINRLSVGVQSLNDKCLKKIGRLHDKNTAIEKIKLARKYFDNVSVDLIVGLENQDGKTLCKHAKMLLDLGVKHVSCYLLEIYDNTILGKQVKEKKYKPLDDNKMIEAFNKLSNYLQDRGLNRYEISNFAYEGYESKHNLNYWSRGNYLGFGLSAHSFVENKRTQNADTIELYEKKKVTQEVLTKKEENEENIMLGLRSKIGVDLKKLRENGYDLSKNSYYNEYVKQGILIETDDRVFLNPVFYHISNTIISNLFE